VHGIIAYGAYVPYWRLQRSSIGDALGSGGGKGTRSVASYDEDATSMGVEAARNALKSTDVKSAGVLFTTTAPAYLDKTNATAIHAALGFDTVDPAFDIGSSVRSGVAAFGLARHGGGTPRMLIASDVRTGLPGGGDERDGGDAAVAFLFGEGDVIVEPVAAAFRTDEFLDRWRIPGEPASHVWEERFAETIYGPMAEGAVGDVLKYADLTADGVDHVIVAGVHGRAVKAISRSLGARPEAIAPDLTAVVGNTGAAHPWLQLAEVLDRAGANETILLVFVADGVDAIAMRTTDALLAYRERQTATVADQIASGRDDLSYQSFLTWRGFLDREPPRRPDPEAYYGPPAHRTEAWKFAFVGSKCTECGFISLPPARVCSRCSSVDQMTSVPLANTQATIATYTIDRLAYSLSPPTVAAVLDFDGGGRYTCELTDCDPDTVAVGQRVELTFRRTVTAKNIHNYFWKARPIRGGNGGV
jgi:hydroxymethylglutaryl-CoA synthase